MTNESTILYADDVNISVKT